MRASRSALNYVGTIPENPVLTGPPSGWTLSANPQSRYQVTDVAANQTEATYKFNLEGFKHTALAGVELSRETAYIDKYTGLNSEVIGTPSNGAGSVTESVFNPQFTSLPFATPALAGLPTNLAIDTKSAYLIDTANYNDLLILNGGIRYDDYNIGVGASKSMAIASVYAAYATSSDPVGSEFDGTSANYGGIAPALNGNSNQIFGPEKNRAAEVGTKWELFDRHLLVTAALFQTEKDNARESQNVTSATQTATCPYPVTNPPTTGNVPCITAGAAYRIRGIDLEAGGKITPKWSLFGGLVLMQSEVTKSLAPVANTALYTSNVGLPLANVAHQSFSLLSKYQLTDVWEIGGQAVYRSKIYGGTLLAANQGTSLPSYWRFDAFVEAKIDKNWKVKLFVNNVFNKLYYDALYQSSAPFVLEAPGRTASLVISARF